jgi:hypothetical protein
VMDLVITPEWIWCHEMLGARTRRGVSGIDRGLTVRNDDNDVLSLKIAGHLVLFAFGFHVLHHLVVPRSRVDAPKVDDLLDVDVFVFGLGDDFDVVA